MPQGQHRPEESSGGSIWICLSLVPQERIHQDCNQYHAIPDKHIYMNYSCISATDMAVNNKRLWFPYNSEEPVEILVERLNECADFTTAVRDPVTETHLTLIVYGLMAETNVYQEGFWFWMTNPTKSWPALQTHLIKEQADIQDIKQMMWGWGYGSNHMVVIKEAFTNLI